MRQFLILLLCNFVITTCSGTRAVQDVSDTPAAGDAAHAAPAAEPGVEDPLALLHRTLTVPEPEWNMNDAQQAADLPDQYHAAVQDTSEEATAPGWRVQIGSLLSQAQAGEAVLKAKEEFEEAVYLEFDAPLYKVRIGDCLARQSAEDLLSRAIRIGYRDAWIIRTDIFVARSRAGWRSPDDESAAGQDLPPLTSP